jgi:dCTP deaminase
MILTGSEIKKYLRNGDIVISPFNEEQLNPNSYNYRLGDVLTYKEDSGEYKTIKLPEEGFILYPNRVYLGHTFEVLGSRKCAMSLIGRSSTGRLGLFLQVSADLGHTGAEHKWTLELVAAKPIKIYPNMIIGQISFWENYGEATLYEEGYSSYSEPQISKYEEQFMGYKK